MIARAEALDQVDGLKDLDQVHMHVEKVLECQSYEFWTDPWSSSSLDTEAGRAILYKDLKKTANHHRNGKPWHEGLRLIEVLDG